MIFKDSSILVNSNDYTIIGNDINAGNQEFIPLRELMFILPKEKLDPILKSYQNFAWDRRTKFCGVCGGATELDSSDNCKVCLSCKERFYPSLFPAVIVLIIKDDKILLAHNVNFPGNLHSVIAGFVDLGEGLEECVTREVMEEVGIEIKNLKYFGSQNWGFTSSLMIGFTAEYKSGEIKTDNIEIDKANWFTKDNLPELPPSISIARQMIDSFINAR